ncbi:hypothetical protein JANAI62_37660 [Jannaschia pagri]|uniref:WGR domain-containing protein n=1 Tax=Jannaschia pagri TaxID=2829797 RepID=A0ABQ4NS03_9RHOB|nr:MULTISPECIES: WGR domain-containing protein [unclassified Jannaschia]GIT93327.1 hypothetical protein JANAI61_37850 [Jannaschia sp. AI_61]GIT97143.1 hypothetical protein JANAI62_37660 [Jannaschia sp. AI_62]
MYLIRTEPEANLHQFYRMEIARGLFGDWSLIREWGRVGQVRTDWFTTEADTKDARFELHRRQL